tara:strand:- start:1734 stop:2510 length:777 start_codon:yes stop_codon:yes gene_type:complete
MSNNLLVDKILNKIDFKIKPNENIRKSYLYRLKKKFFKIINKEKDFINSNTRFIDVDRSDLATMKKLCTIDTMSQISIGFLVNQICKNLNNEDVYLNIGVWKGFTMFAGMLNTVCEVQGVDNFSFEELKYDNKELKAKEYFYDNFNQIKNSDKHFFSEVDYKVFFKNWSKKNRGIDFYYYDGDHSYQNQFDNLIIVNEFLKKGSIVLIDDYNVKEVEKGTMDFISKYNSKFKVIKELRTANKYIHPTYANGLILIEKI